MRFVCLFSIFIKTGNWSYQSKHVKVSLWLICSSEHYCQLAQLLAHFGNKDSKARWGNQHGRPETAGAATQYGISFPHKKMKSSQELGWLWANWHCYLVLRGQYWPSFLLLWLRHSVQKDGMLPKKDFYVDQRFSKWESFCIWYKDPIITPYIDLRQSTSHLSTLCLMISELYIDVIMNWQIHIKSLSNS